MKAKLFKILHYTAFVAFVAFAVLALFVPLPFKVVIGVLLGLFLVHTFVHGQSVAADIHEGYEEFRAMAVALKAKFITALTTFVDSVEVNPTVGQATTSAAPGSIESRIPAPPVAKSDISVTVSNVQAPAAASLVPPPIAPIATNDPAPAAPPVAAPVTA